MYDWYNIGDRVKIHQGKATLRGVIKSLRTSVHPIAGTVSEFGVLLDDVKSIVYYNGWDLSVDLSVPKQACTCGATAAHDPYPAPGHAYHCESLKKLEKVGLWDSEID
jgi:hypothetical protein